MDTPAETAPASPVVIATGHPSWTWVLYAYFALLFACLAACAFGLISGIGPLYGLAPCATVCLTGLLLLVYQLPISSTGVDRKLVLDADTRLIIAEGFARYPGSRRAIPSITARFDEIVAIRWGRVARVDFVVIRGRDIHGLPFRLRFDCSLRPYGDVLRALHRLFPDRIGVPWYARLFGSGPRLLERGHPDWRRAE